MSGSKKIGIQLEIGDNLDGEGKSFWRQVGVWLEMGENLVGDGEVLSETSGSLVGDW